MRVSRRKLALVAVLMLVVAAGVATSLRGRSGDGPERSQLTPAFALELGEVLTLEVSTGEPRDAIEREIPPFFVVIAKRQVSVVDGNGKLLRSAKVPDATAGGKGDVDGDGQDEILVATAAPPQVVAMDASLRVRWQASLGAPARRLLPVDFEGDGRREVVTADARGRVSAFSSTGELLWQSPAAAGSAAEQEPRGLDDVRLGEGRKERWPAVGYRGGTFAVMRPDGGLSAEARVTELRRLRTGDLDGDRKSELLVGDDGGSLRVFDATGRPQWSWGLGEAVGEIRAFEHDGDPSAAAVALGGKTGALMAVRPPRGVEPASTLWSDSLGSKITALAAIDCDGDGRDELFAGTESGTLTAFRADGALLARIEHGGGELQTIRALREGAGRTLVLAAAGRTLAAYRLERFRAPGWYGVGSAFGLASLVLLAALVGLLRLPVDPPPVPSVTASPEALAQRVQAAQVDRLERLAASGRLAPERVRERRAQVAADAAAARPARSAAPPAPPPPSRHKS